VIAVRDLTKDYGRLRALDGVSFTVDPGEVMLLLGPNGAGKSTLLRCLLGVTAYRGSIHVAGLDPLSQGKALRHRVGYMPQAGSLHLDLTVDETVAFYAALRRLPAARGRRLLAELGLAGRERHRVGELSGGMRQRLGFALALLSAPPVLLLDEPTSGLDAGSRDLLAAKVRALAAAGTTVLLSTHTPEGLAAVGDRALRLGDGRLESISSTPLLASPRQRGEGRCPPGADVAEPAVPVPAHAATYAACEVAS
jgi:ABC-type multidrug transport system ATPase subunit